MVAVASERLSLREERLPVCFGDSGKLVSDTQTQRGKSESRRPLGSIQHDGKMRRQIAGG